MNTKKEYVNIGTIIHLNHRHDQKIESLTTTTKYSTIEEFISNYKKTIIKQLSEKWLNILDSYNGLSKDQLQVLENLCNEYDIDSKRIKKLMQSDLDFDDNKLYVYAYNSNIRIEGGFKFVKDFNLGIVYNVEYPIVFFVENYAKIVTSDKNTIIVKRRGLEFRRQLQMRNDLIKLVIFLVLIFLLFSGYVIASRYGSILF